MLSFISHNSRYTQTSIYLCALTLLTVVTTLPPFRAGIWHQVEPMMFVHSILCLAAALWLAVGIHTHQLIIRKPSIPEGVILSWVGLQMIAVVFSTSSWRAWFGSPGDSESAMWWTIWLVSLVLFQAIWEIRRTHKPLLSCACFITASLALLHFFTGDGEYIYEWAPNKWPDYLAFFAAYLWLIFSSTQYAKHNTCRIFILALCLFALLTSNNITGILLLIPAFAFTIFIAAFKPLRRLFYPLKRWRIVACILCVLPVGWYGFTAQYQHDDPALGYTIEDSIFAAKDQGMGSRVLLNKVAFDALTDDPKRMLFGKGAGHFTDDLFRYALVDGTAVFRGTIREPNWFLIDGTAYHVHSQPLQALLSFGVVGFVVWFAMPIMLLWHMPRHLFWRTAPILVATTALGFFWFEVPHLLAVNALAWATLLPTAKQRSPIAHRPYIMIGFCLIAVVIAWSAYEQYRAIQYGNKLTNAVMRSNCYDLSEATLAEDFKRGGERFAEIVNAYAIHLSNASRVGPIDQGAQACFELFFNTARKMPAYDNLSLYAAGMDLQMHYEILLSIKGEQFGDLRKQAASTLENAMFALLERAPKRDDKAALFLANLGAYTRHDAQKQFEILDRMLKISPSHRSAMWLMGHLLMQDERVRETGMAMKKQAEDMYVERVFPLTSNHLDGERNE